MSLLYPPFQKRLFETIHVLRLLLRNIFALRCYLGVTLRVYLWYTFGCYLRDTWTWEYRITWLSVVPYTRGTKNKQKKQKTTKLKISLTNIVLREHTGQGCGSCCILQQKVTNPQREREKAGPLSERHASARARTSSSPERA